MKHKVLITTSITIGVALLCVLISTLVIGSSLDTEKQLAKLLAQSQGDDKLTQYLNHVIDQKQITNIYQFATFSLWIEGAATNYTIYSFHVASFILMWGFILPILGVLFALILATLILLIVVELIKREYKYKIIKAVGKWGMYASFISLVLFTTIFIILIAVLEKQFNQLPLASEVNANRTNHLNSLLNGTLIIMIFTGIANVDKQIIDPNIVNSGLLVTTNVFLTVFMAISLICLIAFSSIWIATFISYRNNSLSKFTRWLGNIRIDSHREFRQIILRNIYFWVLLGFLTITVIYPGLVHKYETPAQFFIAVVIVCAAVAVFTPTYIAVIRISSIKMFNYNRMMFIQIILLSTVIGTLQLVMWLLFGDQIMGPTWLMIAFPFYSIATAIVCTFGFIKWRQ